MTESIKIKGKQIGQGKPLVCVPVMEGMAEQIVEEVSKLSARGTEMIEWRVDAFELVQDIGAVQEVLKLLGDVIGNSILVFTFRSKKQGGLIELREDIVYELQLAAANSGVVDFVDVEILDIKEPQNRVTMLQEYGVKVIGSHHNFQMTPNEEEIQFILEMIKESNADIVKLAVMPQNNTDVLRLLTETNRFHENNPNRPLITMSMGAMGGISRVAGEYFGSCVSFGAGDVCSAPGQFPMQDLEHLLEVIHHLLER